jgi:serine/threonine protein kinase
MPGCFLLTLVESDGSVRERRLAPGSYVIGRELDCDVVVSSLDVSRHHARLTLNQVELVIEDLGGTAGTRVQNLPVTKPQHWPYPQSLSVGSVKLEVRMLEEDAVEVPLTALGADPKASVPFVFGNEIARGGMGSIIEADDKKLGRKIAVKVMLLESAAEGGQKQRFVQEAAVLGRLAHPNIVPVYDLGMDSEGQLYYSMKLVKGRTLRAILRDLANEVPAAVKHYTLDRLLTVFRKVCDAVAFAHSKGIIHRDLKPENVMVGEFGEVLVMDWGLAKVIDEELPEIPTASLDPATAVSALRASQVPGGSVASLKTPDGAVMGTPQYMSPEQAEGRIADMDGRSDIFSLGGILYCMLTLRPPVEGGTLEEVLQKVVSGRIVPPSAFGTTAAKSRPGAKGKVVEAKKIKPLPHCPGGRVPAALSAVDMKALSVDRTERYQNVAALQHDIEAYQTGFATSAEHAGAWKQLTLLVKRHKAASIGIAAVLLIGGTLGTKAIVEGQRANRALAELKKSAPALLQLAESEADHQRFDSALEKMDAALSLDSTLPGALWERTWLLAGLERWDDALAASRIAQEKDPAPAHIAQLLPTLEEFASAPSDEDRWKSERTTRLLALLQEAKATATLVKLSNRLIKEAGPRQQLVRTKLDAWLRRSAYKTTVTAEGLIRVETLPRSTASIEPLRGLPINELDLTKTQVQDLGPLRGMALRYLHVAETPVSDLSPLHGMPLKTLLMDECHSASDLSPLAGLPLERLEANKCGIADLKPLKGAPLKILSLVSNRITDLSPLAGAPLEHLNLHANQVSDLSPLRGMPLEDLDLSGTQPKDLTPLLDLHKLETLRCIDLKESFSVLRYHPTLKHIGGGRDFPFLPVEQFWKEYDAKHPAGAK